MTESNLVKQLLKGINVGRTSNPAEKALAFYKTIIDLERSKEPDIRDYFSYPINYKNERIMLIDFPCNEQFLKVFELNRNQNATKWPNDLNVCLIAVVNHRSYRLLNMVIDYDDIKEIDIDNELLPIRISNFEVNLKEAAQLEFTSEKIEAINNGIKSKPTMKGLLEVLRKEISDNIVITNSIYLALSTKSIELAQIYSELNNPKLTDTLRSPSLLTSFLTNESIDNVVDNIDVDQLINVTPLDKSQKQAVANAMNARVSVITGPPGTGKTQVIENILANALLKGKKVLVASKNNKAVENVKERFDKIDNTTYLIRFGAKQYMAEHTLPEINRILSETNSNAKDRSLEYQQSNSQYLAACKAIKEGKESLKRRDSIVKELPLYKKKVEEIQNINGQLKLEHDKLLADIDVSFEDVLPLKDMNEKQLNECSSILKKQRETITKTFTGFFGFWHNWFSIDKFALLLVNDIESFPFQIKGYLESKRNMRTIEQLKNYNEMLNYCNVIQRAIDRSFLYHNQVLAENHRYDLCTASTEKELSQSKAELAKIEKEYKMLNQCESSYLQMIESNKKWIELNSTYLLSEYIRHNKQIEQASKKISRYKTYIPNAIPWKDNDYSIFTKCTLDFLDVIKLCAVTSLSTKNAFPLAKDLFDMVVIDEASQCDISSAIPLIMRAKQLVVIGDPMQLKHISLVKHTEEQEIKKHLQLEAMPHIKYVDFSLWDYCQAFINVTKAGFNKPQILAEHYRCHPAIIGYSNKMFYEKIMGHKLDVRTDTSNLKIDPQGIVIVDVKGLQHNDNENVNEEEVKKAIQLAIQTIIKYPDASVGIVTPFRHQAERINSEIPPQFANQIEANTVHKYQGDEKDVMIYSLVVTSNSPVKKIEWIDNVVPNLVNVAVTRAKSTLYVVCNVDYILSHSSDNKPLGHLVRYKY